MVILNFVIVAQLLSNVFVGQSLVEQAKNQSPFIAYFNRHNEIMVRTCYEKLEELKYNQVYRLNHFETAVQLTTQYDNYKMYSFVVKLAPISFYNGDINKALLNKCFARVFQLFNKHFRHIIADIETIGVVEYSPKGHHMHMCALTPIQFHTNIITNMTKFLEGLKISVRCIDIKECICKDELNMYDWTLSLTDNFHFFNLNTIITFQKIRSTTSYINYLRKNPKTIFHHELQCGKYYVHFNRTYIFDEKSLPKYEHENINVLSNNAITLLFYKLFNDNIIEYSEVMKQNIIQQYLHIPNIHQIYNNCLQQYTSSYSHVKNLIRMIELYEHLDKSEKCCCAVYEWCLFQDIDIGEFMNMLAIWFNCTTKKNTLLFQGPPNGGKSHVARLIWRNFLFNKRIVQDGIFSFANLRGAGCALWDEPMIAPDLADTTKLILEGEPDVNIVIKNQSSTKLNKRVPIIITSNSNIYKYCSGERDAFEERYYKILVNKRIDLKDFCIADNHFCPLLDTADSTSSPFGRKRSAEVHLGRGQTSPSEKTCKGIHKINENQILSFIVQSLTENLDTLEPFPNASLEDEQRLFALLTNNKGKNCYLSSNLHTFIQEYNG